VAALNSLASRQITKFNAGRTDLRVAICVGKAHNRISIGDIEIMADECPFRKVNSNLAKLIVYWRHRQLSRNNVIRLALDTSAPAQR
jgi:hypothetical protein